MALVNGELGEKVVFPEEYHVGREFCLQYYTILTKKTDNIHRFYDEDSQMTRGSSEITVGRGGYEIVPLIPARGQKEIHKRMMAENLRNAKVKVLHFDVQKVAGDSQLLTIQVCGEQTNDDGPMRRFMESFVLKRTDAKKCYVVNNIFRFQDQVFCNGTEDSNGNDSLNATTVQDGSLGTEQTINEVPIADNLTLAAASGDEDNCREKSNDTTSIKDESSTHLGSLGDTTEIPKPYEVIENLVDMPAKEELPDSTKIEEKSDIDKSFESKEQVNDIQPETVTIAGNGAENNRSSAQSGRSWANLVSQGISTPPKPQNIQSNRAPRSAPAAIHTHQTTQIINSQESTVAASTIAADTKATKGQRESTPNATVGDNSAGGSTAEKTKYPDNVQVFVGNIPIAMKSDTLKEFFNDYGEVVDVRINVSKSNGRLPNFGFVIFKAHETVQQVLEKRPIYIDNHRLNVEEKKPNGNRGPRQPVMSGGPASGPNRNGFGPRPRRA